MRLFVWTEFVPDYTPGLAFAIADNVVDAQNLVIEQHGFCPVEWGPVQEFPVTEARAFCVAGGG